MNENEFILTVSERLNANGAFEAIQQEASSKLNIEIDNNSDVWNRIEEAILNTILEGKEEGIL